MTDAGGGATGGSGIASTGRTTGLEPDDVRALALDRERRRRRTLDRAHAMMHAHAGEPQTVGGRRTGLTRAVKQAVWERCGGRCAECGATRSCSSSIT